MLLTMQDSDDFIYRGTIAQLAYITKLICIISKQFFVKKNIFTTVTHCP